MKYTFYLAASSASASLPPVPAHRPARAAARESGPVMSCPEDPMAYVPRGDVNP